MQSDTLSVPTWPAKKGWRPSEPNSDTEIGIEEESTEHDTAASKPECSDTDQSTEQRQPWVETDVDKEVYKRVEDLVLLAPTTNGELADTWDMVDGREASNYLTMELSDYYERNEDKKLQPTSKAKELVS